MKKTVVAIMLALVMVLSVVGLTGCGSELDYAEGLTPSQGLEFKHISEDGTGFNFGLKDQIKDDADDCYILTGIGTCKDTDIVVPAEYNGKPVRGISERAFFNGNLTSVVLPNSVQVLAGLAFGRSGSLTSVKGNGVYYYSNSVFGSCSIPDLVLSQKAEYIGKTCFFFSPNAKTVWIPKTVKEIGLTPFLDSAHEKIYFEGSEDEWNAIKIEEKINIPVEFNVKFPNAK